MRGAFQEPNLGTLIRPLPRTRTSKPPFAAPLMGTMPPASVAKVRSPAATRTVSPVITMPLIAASLVASNWPSSTKAPVARFTAASYVPSAWRGTPVPRFA